MLQSLNRFSARWPSQQNFVIFNFAINPILSVVFLLNCFDESGKFWKTGKRNNAAILASITGYTDVRQKCLLFQVTIPNCARSHCGVEEIVKILTRRKSNFQQWKQTSSSNNIPLPYTWIKNKLFGEIT